MRISEMGDEHLLNCIDKIARSGGVWRAEYLECLVSEAARRGLGELASWE